MEEQVLNFQDIFQAARRHAVKIAAIMTVCAVATMAAYKLTPKRFKSVASVAIKQSYFQTPLVTDFVQGSRDQSQMEAEKEALIRAALDDAFIDSVGESFELFQKGVSAKEHSIERQSIRRRIEYVSLGATTYQFAAQASDAQVASKINQFVIDHVMDKFIEARRQDLLKFRDSLKRQLDSMGMAAPASAGNTLAAPDQLRDELADVEARITVMEGQFTPSHPSVIALKRKAEVLRKTLENPNLSAPGAETVRAKAANTLDAKDPKFELYVDIMKKLNYLDIILQLEKDRKSVTYLELVERPNVPLEALYPKLPNFALAGILIGLLISGSLVGYLEVKRASVLTPELTSRNFGVPMLGVLPAMAMNGGKLLENAPGNGPSSAFKYQRGG